MMRAMNAHVSAIRLSITALEREIEAATPQANKVSERAAEIINDNWVRSGAGRLGLGDEIFQVTVVGDVVRGGVRPGIEGLAIDMKGWLPREEVAKAIVEADAVVMPSRWEGLPLVALETMRAGRALIATNGGAFRHLVQDGETGALIDNGDPQFLVDTLSRYGIADFRRMGIAARAAYEAGFRADRMNEELLGLYRELAAA